MKSQFLPLLKYEVMRFAWLVPLIYGFFVMHIYRHLADKGDYMFFLDSSGSETNTIMALWFGFSAMFFASGIRGGQKTGPAGSWSPFNLDFFFSRAIDRRVWFAIKTGMFLLAVMIPIVVRWHTMQSSPSVRIELPYNPIGARKHLTDFYLTNFAGAHLQAPDTGRNEDYVVLPYGRSAMADYFLASEMLMLTLFQVFAFVLWPRGWGLGLAFAVALGLAVLLAFPSGSSPSRYEVSVAFVGNHTFSCFVALLVLYLASQFYCCWRFVRTEMTA